MPLPREVAWTAALAAPVTAAYLAVASGGPPAASGLVGHGLGLLGLLAMAAGTGGYAWRKRRNGPGSMQRWLEAHVVTGLLGPYLVLLHTGFAFRGVAGAAFLLLALVVVSGLVGRFGYTRIPKPPPGFAARREPQWRASLEGVSAGTSSAAFAGVVAAAVGQGIARHDLLLEQAQAATRHRRAIATWWLLHVPVAMAMFVLAIAHAMAALYYATLLR